MKCIFHGQNVTLPNSHFLIKSLNTISFRERHIAMADSTSLKWSPLISVLSIYGIVNNHRGRGANNEILSLIACH